MKIFMNSKAQQAYGSIRADEKHTQNQKLSITKLKLRT